MKLYRDISLKRADMNTEGEEKDLAASSMKQEVACSIVLVLYLIIILLCSCRCTLQYNTGMKEL